jgi:hypothetical protein
MELTLALHPMLKSGRWLFPGDWLGNATPDALLSDSSAARAAFAPLFEALDRERIEARTAMENVRLPPALMLQWPLTQRDYQRLRAMPSEQLLREEPRDGMLRRLWIAWRAVRQTSKSNGQD